MFMPDIVCITTSICIIKKVLKTEHSTLWAEKLASVAIAHVTENRQLDTKHATRFVMNL